MISLTVKTDNLKFKTYNTPRVRYFDERFIKIIGGEGNDTVIQYTPEKTKQTMTVAESAAQVMALINGPRDTRFVSIQTLSANGTTQGSGTLVTSFLARVTTASAGNTAVTLPKATVLDVTYTVINASGIDILVFPAVGDGINQQAVNTSITVTSGSQATFIITSIS